MASFIQRHYGAMIDETIGLDEECPISQDTFLDKPLSMYCLYGTNTGDKLVSKYFDTDYLYNWLLKCRNTPGLSPTNPITREEISDTIFNRIEKYYFLMKDIGDISRTDDIHYFTNFKKEVVAGKPVDDILNNPIYLALLDVKLFKNDFIKSSTKFVENEPTTYTGNLCNFSRELAYKMLEKCEVGSWLIRPSSVTGDDYNIPVVVTIIDHIYNDDPHYINYLFSQKRGVGLVEYSSSICREDDICHITDFTIVADLFLELFKIKTELDLTKYIFIDA